METYTMTDAQWQKINSALNVAITVCLMHKREFHKQMLEAAETMDEVVNGELGDEE